MSALLASEAYSYHPIQDLSEAMARERATRALAGDPIVAPLLDERIQSLLKRHLSTPPHFSHQPWIYGRLMVGPKWLFGHTVARVVNDSLEGFCVAWTRQPHRAYKKHTVTLDMLAVSILRGEVTDGWIR